MLLRNARVVLAAATIESANVIVENGRIAGISESDVSAPASSPVIDLTGKTLFPGFVDVHIHGAAGVDTLEAEADDLQRVGAFLAQHGVTAWLPTLVPATEDQYQRAVRAVADCLALGEDAEPQSAARVLGVHYEGPFVNDQQCGALHREYFRTFRTAGDLDSLPVINHPAAIHMMTLAPEVAGGIQLIEELTRRGWVSSIGHTKANTDVLDAAFNAGARHMTHFMNAMTPIHHRTVGAAGWGLTRAEVTFDLIADGIHLDPQIVKLMVRSKTSANVSLISDAVAAAGLGDGEYEIWGEQIKVRSGRTQNAQGSIAGSVITMLEAARLMLALGFSECEVAQMSSTNPARLLKIDHEYGSIESGKRADLVALDEQGQVQLTIIGGRIAFQDLS